MTVLDTLEDMTSRQETVSLLSRMSKLSSGSSERPELTHFSGIYVPDDERWPAHFRGIGIRIEDSVCVGDDHPIVLTPEAVKEVSCLPFLAWNCIDFYLGCRY
jgi:hypothetical protein